MKTSPFLRTPISDATFFTSQIAFISLILLSFLSYPIFDVPSTNGYVLISGAVSMLCCAGLLAGLMIHKQHPSKIHRGIQFLMVSTLFITSILMIISGGGMDPVEALLVVFPVSLVYLSGTLSHLDNVLRLKKGLDSRTNTKQITLFTLLFSVATALVFALLRGGLTALPMHYFLVGILIYTGVFFVLLLPFRALTMIGITVGGR
jgi:hypothetical protein